MRMQHDTRARFVLTLELGSRLYPRVNADTVSTALPRTFAANGAGAQLLNIQGSPTITLVPLVTNRRVLNVSLAAGFPQDNQSANVDRAILEAIHATLPTISVNGLLSKINENIGNSVDSAASILQGLNPDVSSIVRTIEILPPSATSIALPPRSIVEGSIEQSNNTALVGQAGPTILDGLKHAVEGTGNVGSTLLSQVWDAIPLTAKVVGGSVLVLGGAIGVAYVVRSFK